MLTVCESKFGKKAKQNSISPKIYDIGIEIKNVHKILINDFQISIHVQVFILRSKHLEFPFCRGLHSIYVFHWQSLLLVKPS